jgi:hypothetical protein
MVSEKFVVAHALTLAGCSRNFDPMLPVRYNHWLLAAPLH